MTVGDTFQKQVSISNASWSSGFKPEFEIQIKDPNAKYQTFILVRNDDSYPFSNIWLRPEIKGPGDKALQSGEPINLELADPAGNWLGKGMGSIWEHKIPLSNLQSFHFSKPGIYHISLTQIMREDPLPGILNVGLIIQKLN